ncbi:MAG TPA: TonB-dependent receptor [Puia sp.]|nr:TonB-dependent receptor [Puia sp.]
MPKILLTGGLLMMLMAANGQRLILKGKVVDSISRKGLASATISLVRAADSALVTFGIADSAGAFRLVTVGGGPYLLSVSYTGYQPVWRALAGGVNDVGEIVLGPNGLLQAAQVGGRRPPVEINHDTIEFNAENFKTQPNAVVEDMLRKIPGVTVESDGTIKVNGQTVRRILVNGKEFFTGDTKMATKNLNADAVDKLQVFDRKSDQASFTGVDDGNSEKTINIQLKKDRNFATFGKVGAGGGADGGGAGAGGGGMGVGGSGVGGGAGVGGGTGAVGGGADRDGRYDGQANINRFRGDEQLSFLGMGNNTNRQGFTVMDVLNFTGELSRGMRNGGGGISIQTSNAGNNNGLPVTGLGQSQQGIAQTFAGGVNYNNTWGQGRDSDKGRTSLNTNYTASDIRLVTDRQSLIENVGDSTYSTFDTTHTVTHITQQRLGLILDQTVDPSFSWRLTPTLTWQHTNKSQAEGYSSVESYSSAAGDSLLNYGNNQTGSAPGALNLVTDLLLRKRLAKKGRTLSLDVNVNYNHSTDQGSQVSDNSFSFINQQYQRDANTRSAGGNLTYTEPLGARSLVALSSFYDINTGNTDKATTDFDAVSGKYDLPDSGLSNHFSSDYRYGGGGVSLRSNLRKMNLTAGATVQDATLHTMNLTGGDGLKQRWVDLLPNALLQYNFSQTKNLRLEYETYTTQPSVVQLQPVPDLSNPLDISTGNPKLKRTYNQNLTLNYLVAQFARRRHLMFMLSASDAAGAIVQSDSVTAFGTRMTMPVNTNGVGNLLSNVDYGFPIRKWHGDLEAEASFVFSRNAAYVNGAKNNINSTSFRPALSYAYVGSDKLDLELTAAVSLNSGRYSLQPELNTNYVRQHYEINMTNYLPAGVSIHNEFNYIFNTGRPAGYNTSTPLWNLSVAKSLFRHDRGEIKVSVMDVLDQNSGITRSIEQGSVQDERYNVLQRYFLLSFTYSLNKSGLKAKGGPLIRVRNFAQ